MKGKKGNAAARRQTVQELEARADRAERAEARLISELDELRMASERRDASNRQQVSQLKRQRDDASSPDLDAALRRIAEMVKECRDMEQRLARLRDSWSRAHRIAVSLLMRQGHAGAKADAALVIATKIYAADPSILKHDTIAMKTARRHGDGALDAIAKARGFDNAQIDGAIELADELKAMIYPVRECS